MKSFSRTTFFFIVLMVVIGEISKLGKQKKQNIYFDWVRQGFPKYDVLPLGGA